jgi:hypothetical protein
LPIFQPIVFSIVGKPLRFMEKPQAAVENLSYLVVGKGPVLIPKKFAPRGIAGKPHFFY